MSFVSHSDSRPLRPLEVAESAPKTNWLGVGLAMLFALVAFFSGFHLGTENDETLSLQAGLFSIFAAPEPLPVDEVSLDEFWRVWHLLDEKFVHATATELTNAEKLQGAIDGLVDAYDDPYTVFLPPEDAAFFEEDISGNFSGVGMEVGIRDDVVTVIAPLPDSPAENAGILAGDSIISINGTSTEDMNIDQAVRLIRGEKGTTVTLEIYRDGATEFQTVDIIRDTIAVPTIKTSREGDVFIIKLFSFNALSEMRMQEALREYIRSGADKLIIDLRGNPGGFLQSAISISSYFLPAGKVIVRESFGDGREEEVFRSQGKTLRQFAPKEMVVLIDGGSASASEILAGALQEQGVATLIGAQTFGKGSVQELVSLPSGASLKVTIARWLTPNGVSISDGGLTPDIEVERTPEQFLADEDPQLEAALEYLNRN